MLASFFQQEPKYGSINPTISVGKVNAPSISEDDVVTLIDTAQYHESKTRSIQLRVSSEIGVDEKTKNLSTELFIGVSCFGWFVNLTGLPLTIGTVASGAQFVFEGSRGDSDAKARKDFEKMLERGSTSFIRRTRDKIAKQLSQVWSTGQRQCEIVLFGKDSPHHNVTLDTSDITGTTIRLDGIDSNDISNVKISGGKSNVDDKTITFCVDEYQHYVSASLETTSAFSNNALSYCILLTPPWVLYNSTGFYVEIRRNSFGNRAWVLSRNSQIPLFCIVRQHDAPDFQIRIMKMVGKDNGRQDTVPVSTWSALFNPHDCIAIPTLRLQKLNNFNNDNNEDLSELYELDATECMFREDSEKEQFYFLTLDVAVGEKFIRTMVVKEVKDCDVKHRVCNLTCRYWLRVEEEVAVQHENTKENAEVNSGDHAVSSRDLKHVPQKQTKERTKTQVPFDSSNVTVRDISPGSDEAFVFSPSSQSYEAQKLRIKLLDLGTKSTEFIFTVSFDDKEESAEYVTTPIRIYLHRSEKGVLTMYVYEKEFEVTQKMINSATDELTTKLEYLQDVIENHQIRFQDVSRSEMQDYKDYSFALANISFENMSGKIAALKRAKQERESLLKVAFDGKFRFGVTVPHISIVTMLNRDRGLREMLHLHIENVSLGILIESTGEMRINANLGDIQVDNQLDEHDPHFPVILQVEREEKRELNERRFIDLYMKLKKSNARLYIKKAEIKVDKSVKSLAVKVESSFIANEILPLVRFLTGTLKNRQKSVSNGDLGYLQEIANSIFARTSRCRMASHIRNSKARRNRIDPIIERFDTDSLNLSLSFKMQDDGALAR